MRDAILTAELKKRVKQKEARDRVRDKEAIKRAGEEYCRTHQDCVGATVYGKWRLKGGIPQFKYSRLYSRDGVCPIKIKRLKP